MRIKSVVQSITMVSLFLMNCSGKKEVQSQNEILECLLDYYIEHYKIEEDKLILVKDYQGWTDTSSVVIINSHHIEKKSIEGEILESKYKKVKINYHHGILVSTDSLYIDLENLERSILNNFKWKKTYKPIQILEGIPPLQEFNEIQLIYKPKGKCIEAILLGDQELESAIENECVFCR